MDKEGRHSINRCSGATFRAQQQLTISYNLASHNKDSIEKQD